LNITIYDIDFFRDNRDIPIWGKIVVFLFGKGSIVEFIWYLLYDKGLKFLGYVVNLFVGFYIMGFFFTFRGFLSPITTIMQYFILKNYSVYFLAKGPITSIVQFFRLKMGKDE